MAKEEVTAETVSAEADIAGIETVLSQLDEKDFPKEEDKLAEYLREQVPGLDKATDEEVLSAFRTSKETTGTTTAVPPTAFTPEGFGFFDKDGNTLTDIPREVQRFLAEHTIGYKALGKDQTPKNISELVRTASRGHFNQEQYNQLSESNKQTLEQLTESQEQTTNFQQQASEWDRILSAAARNDGNPFLQAVQTYIDNLNQPVDNRLTEAQTRIKELEKAQEGQTVFDQELKGPLQELATKHNIPTERFAELENYVLEKFASDPSPSITTPQALQYINQMLPYELENMGFPTGGVDNSNTTAVTTQQPNLASQVQSLQAKLETLENASAAAAASKGPPGSSAAGEGAGGAEDMTAGAKTSAELFQILRDR